MKEYDINGCSLLYITEQQMQIRGGAAFKEIFKLARYLKFVFDFIEEYKEDIERGFDKGWRSF